MAKVKGTTQDKLVVNVDPKAVAKAQQEITKIGHARLYVPVYPKIEAALGKLPKGMSYDSTKSSKENCTKLAQALLAVGLAKDNGAPYKVGVVRDMLRCFFRDTRNTGKVISHLVGKDTTTLVKHYTALGYHKYIQTKRAQEPKA